MKCSDFTILFADDDAGARAIYKKAFEKEGFKVLLEEGGTQVMAVLKANKVDLLVLDLEMPGMNTLELFPYLDMNYPRLPVIIVSGRYQGLTEEFMARGYKVKIFLNKPVAISTLKENIFKLLKIDPEEKATAQKS